MATFFGVSSSKIDFVDEVIQKLNDSLHYACRDKETKEIGPTDLQKIADNLFGEKTVEAATALENLCYIRSICDEPKKVFLARHQIHFACKFWKPKTVNDIFGA